MSGCVVDTDSVDLTVDGGVLQADARISAQGGNQIEVLADGLFATGAPTGAVLFFPVVTPPTGWLVCDGSAVSRTTYASLFALIGTTFGVGNGTTTFNLPDLAGRAPIGLGSHSTVSAIGDNEGLAAASRSPHHNTSFSDPGHSHPIDTVGSEGGDYGVQNAEQQLTVSGPIKTSTTGITVGPGSGSLPTDTIAFLTLVGIIKY